MDLIDECRRELLIWLRVLNATVLQRLDPNASCSLILDRKGGDTLSFIQLHSSEKENGAQAAGRDGTVGLEYSLTGEQISTIASRVFNPRGPDWLKEALRPRSAPHFA